MKQRHLWRVLAVGGTSGIVLAMLVGCPSGGVPIEPTLVPPTIAGASVTTPGGNLVLSQAALVTVSASVLSGTGAVQAVTANLSAIGGPSAQPLVLDTATNIWTSALTVVPAVSGTRQVTVTALDSNNLTDQATATINVINTAGGGGNLPPQLTNASASGSLVASFDSQVTVSVQATDPDGSIVGVTADLTQIGGSSNQLLAQSITNTAVWSFTGQLVPPSTGTKTILFEATDNQGATGTATAAIVVITATP